MSMSIKLCANLFPDNVQNPSKNSVRRTSLISISLSPEKLPYIYIYIHNIVSLLLIIIIILIVIIIIAIIIRLD